MSNKEDASRHFKDTAMNIGFLVVGAAIGITGTCHSAKKEKRLLPAGLKTTTVDGSPAVTDGKSQCVYQIH